MITGTVINIQRFCTDDGPGIRTTVFLKGCPLRCVWCHNPESQAKPCEVSYDAKKCAVCGACAAVCSRNCHTVDGRSHRLDRERCIGCGACAEVCPSEALVLYGSSITVDEAYNEVAKDRVFYETSGGGVTVSGGEPLFQPEFTAELLRRCRKQGIHTAIETCGFAGEQALLTVLEHCDLVLFDIKETDEERHRQYTGVPLEPILNNLRLINEKKIPFVIRAPIIPSLNDRASHFEGLSTLRDSMDSCLGIQLMPYHKIGAYKYELLNKDYGCKDSSEPTKEMIDAWNQLL